MPDLGDLREDQVEAAAWLMLQREAFLILPVGYGKTVVTLTAIERIRRAHPDWRVLVVSTKNIVLHTWGQEIAAWDHLSSLSYAAATGSKAKREKAIRSKPDVLGINFESLTKFYDMVDEDPSLLPEILVIDESSKMKDPSAKRVRRHAGFRKRGDPRHMNRGYVHRFKRRFALSATPAPEGYAGLWSQEACISPDRRLGANISAFRERYCHGHWNGFAMEWRVTADGERRIEEALEPISFVAPERKYMDLPDPIHSRVFVDWTPAARAEYEKLREDFVLGLGEGESVVAGSAGVALNKLRQICSGFIYDADGQAHPTADTDAKLDALEEVIERCGDAPVVVFTQYVAEQRAIETRFKEAQIGLPDDLSRWNRGDVPLLVLHPRSAGHGVNLQHGSHVAIWFSLPFSYEEFHQANGRLHRTGQRHQVSIIRLERPDSVEQSVWTALQHKGNTLDRFIEAVRA